MVNGLKLIFLCLCILVLTAFVSSCTGVPPVGDSADSQDLSAVTGLPEDAADPATADRAGPSVLPEQVTPSAPENPEHQPTNPTTEPPADPPTEPPTEPETEATDLTGSLAITTSNNRSTAALLDSDYETRISFREGVTITVSAPEDIYSLYIIWGLPPGEWSVNVNVEDDNPAGETEDSLSVHSQIFGQHGFIHEYAALEYPANELIITIPENGAVICEIYAFSGGYPPEWVQTWQPPAEKADILIFPTHADDEHLYFLGILPYYGGELGYTVQVAYIVNHWYEQPRPHELLNGLWTVGNRNYPVISEFNDRYTLSLEDARTKYNFNSLINYQVEQIRRFKPSVVVGHDLNGEYGHGVHMLGAHALLTAVDTAADSSYHTQSYEKYGIWDTPKLYLHLYPENSITMDWHIPLERFNGATAYEMAVAGYACHESQHRWSFRVSETGPRGYKFGLVRSLVGEDTEGSCLLENITQ